MTDFTRINLTVATTGRDTTHQVGCNVLTKDWLEMRMTLTQLAGAEGELRFRVEATPRGTPPEGQWNFVWIIMAPHTPISVLLYLAGLTEQSSPAVQFLPNEFP